MIKKQKLVCSVEVSFCDVENLHIRENEGIKELIFKGPKLQCYIG